MSRRALAARMRWKTPGHGATIGEPTILQVDGLDVELRFKNVQNVGDHTAAVDLKVGMGVILDRAAKTAALPASEDEAKACYRIVTNINDKPEMHNFSETTVVLTGEFVRADDLTSIANMEIEFAASEINGDIADLAVGDNMVFGTDGLIAKADAVDGYKVYFEIIEKTAYMGSGILAVIRVQ